MSVKCRLFEEEEKAMEDPEACEHCWHAYRGYHMTVLRNGHVLETCCKCEALKQVHAAHRG